jgi:hypothetical protein
VWALGCTCHSAALAGQYAARTLPKWIDQFCTDVSGHFSHSSKRLRAFKLSQEALVRCRCALAAGGWRLAAAVR